MYFICHTNKNPLTYSCGEKIVFSVETKDACCAVKWELTTDDGKTESGVGLCGKGHPLVVETTLCKPGFARLLCKTNTPEEPSETVCASAGAEVDKLKYLDTVPQDFDNYWAEMKALVDAFDAKLIHCQETTEGIPEDVTCYDVRISTPEGRPASGYVCIPKGKGKYPIVTHFIGYGILGAWKMPDKHAIVACFNAHGIENHLTGEQLTEKYGAQLKGYGHNQEENASNMTTYWRNMMMRNLIALKYVKSLSCWDGKNLTIQGSSQGAFQSTVMASVDSDVSFLNIQVPWFCNLRAEQFGFIPGGRPAFAKGLRYFDTVAHAMRVKCPVKIMIGLGDYTCPPSSTLTLYNHITSPKTLDAVQGLGHSLTVPADAEHFYKSSNTEKF